MLTMNTLPDLTYLTHEQKDELIKLLWEQNQLLRAQNETLQIRVAELELKVKVLEDKLNKNSSNSSKPPSSDGFSKPAPKSRRHKSKKKSGGQKGHQGVTLQRKEMPDKIVVLAVNACEKCNSGKLSKAKIKSSRQVFDIPPLKLEVTEYQIEEKQCQCCGHRTRAQYPEFAMQAVQYGPEIRSVMVYFHQYQLLPYERLAECFYDLFQQRLSQGTLYNTNVMAYEALTEVEEQIKEAIIKSKVVHADETNLRYKKAVLWLHVACNRYYTHYNIHEKRGKEGIDAAGILDKIKGTLVHDHFRAYFHYGEEHSLCNAHILRELTFLNEQHNCQWARVMERKLLKIKQWVEEHYEKFGTALDKKKLESIRRRYMNIIVSGRKETPKRTSLAGVKGRIAQTPAWCLLERLRKHGEDVLRFMYDPTVPFDNNQAERDIRMAKVKQKISGCYRSEKGARIFCRIRSYISTMSKNELSIIDGLRDIFYSRPKLTALLAE